MKVTEKDREAARKACPCWGDGLDGPASCSGTLTCELHHHIAEAIAAAYARGLEDAAKHMVERADKVMADAEDIKLGARSGRRTFLRNCPAWDVERFVADTLREGAAAIRKLGEDK